MAKQAADLGFVPAESLWDATSDLSVLRSLGGFCVNIYVGLGELAQRTVGVLFFLECRVEKLDGFAIAEFFVPAFQRAVSRNLIMFHRLRRGEQANRGRP